MSWHFWSIGLGWLTLSAYLMREWRLSIQVYSLPMLVTLLYPMFIPNSPRWLLTNGKYEEAVKAIKYICKVNGTKVDEKRIKELLTPLIKEINAEGKAKQESSFFTILKYPRVLVRFLALCLVEGTMMVLFFTIILNMDMVHCCLYVTYAISFVLEGPGRMLFGTVFMPRTRRKAMYFAICISSLLFMLTVLLSDNNEDGKFDQLKLITGVTAKYIGCCYFLFTYVMMGEINPTGIRQRSIAFQVL